MMTALWIQLNQARKRFMTGRKRLYAGSLAYKTVLAVVPALAILMAVLAADAFTQKREQILDGFVDVIYPVEGPVGGSFLNPGEKEGIQRLNRTGKDQIHKAVRGFARHAGKVGLVGTLVFFGVLFFFVRDV